MSSRPDDEDFDLARDLPTSAADVAVLRALRSPSLSMDAYFAFLESVGPADSGQLRRRPLTVGPPFVLPDEE